MGARWVGGRNLVMVAVVRRWMEVGWAGGWHHRGGRRAGDGRPCCLRRGAIGSAVGG